MPNLQFPVKDPGLLLGSTEAPPLPTAVSAAQGGGTLGAPQVLPVGPSTGR